ncbi:MAG: FtsW/RodA/SpoVE family cell cycle protein [Bacteroidales bacterium]|nr:FtsW/RodA/SpoVE family cell cycle protein [Bacteroidales bacterium]
MDMNSSMEISELSPVKEVTEKEDSIFSKIFKGDKVIWTVFIILCVISLIEVFSATSTIVYRQQNLWGPILRHATFLIGGVGVILFIHNIPYRYFSSLIFVLLASIVLLILTPFIGTTVNGAERWISIFGFTIQPSEVAKISLIGTIAFLLSKQNGENDAVLFKWMVGLTAVVCGIIAFDNLSTAILLFVVCYLLMFIGKVKFVRLAKVGLAVIGLAAVFVFFLEIIPEDWTQKGILNRADTWKNRIENFASHKEETEESYFTITDENYQVAHAKIAISNGGLLGKFPGNSTERDFLPQAYSDFIYAIIIEELGFLGGVVVLLLYVIILIRSGMIAGKIDRLFPKYLILGSALILSFQAFINMAVAVNLIPVTGQPLPLISRGGTSTLITCAYFGIILSADRFGSAKKKEEDFISHDEEENEDNETNKDESVVEAKDSGDSFEMKEEVEFKIFVCDDEEWGS